MFLQPCKPLLLMCFGAMLASGSSVALAEPCEVDADCNDGLFCTLSEACQDQSCVVTGEACPGLVCDEVTASCKGVGLTLSVSSPGIVAPEDLVSIGIYAVSETGNDHPIGGATIIMAWDASKLTLTGVTPDGPYAWMFTGFPDDSGLDGLNNSWADGDALFEAWGMMLPNPTAIATASGLLVATLDFQAVGPGSASVWIAASFGIATDTKVLDGETSALVITGSLGSPAIVDVVECSIDDHCDDGDPCNGNEQCDANECTPGVPLICQDGIFCNGTDYCEPGVGCASEGNPCPDPASCDEVSQNCGGCAAPDAEASGSRYLAITPSAGADPVALLVVGDSADPSVSCVSAYVQADGTLAAEPFFQTPAQWGTVYAADFEVNPGAKYAVHSDCRFDGTGSLSSAAEVTTWVFGDVSGDGAAFLDDLGLVFDGAQNIFHEGTTLEHLDVAPCVPDGVIDAQDVLVVQGAVNGGSDSCPVACERCVNPGGPPTPEPDQIAKNRYLSLVPSGAGDSRALRVTVVDLPPEFAGYQGYQFWVGSPQDVSEDSGSALANPPTFKSARLGCNPVFLSWEGMGTVHISGEAIIPGATYEVQAIDQSCNLADEFAYSAPLTVKTAQRGDITSVCAMGSCGPPDGDADFDDISSVVDKFKNLPWAPIKARADLAPALPDRYVDFADIPEAVDAFRGLAYAMDGPLPCP